jgi:hypothetical protein
LDEVFYLRHLRKLRREYKLLVNNVKEGSFLGQTLERGPAGYELEYDYT